MIAAAPVLERPLLGAEFDQALGAVADFVDLKSPYTLGHARAVAQLVEVAGIRLGLAANAAGDAAPGGPRPRVGPARRVQRHLGQARTVGSGRVGAGAPAAVPHGADAAAVAALHAIGAVAAQLRERLDGSGYPRGLSGGAITLSARVLGAADVYQAMLEHRPHRPARSQQEAAVELRAEVRAGRIDGDAAEAVLVAAGHRATARRERPAGLTAREVDVLRLVARGLSSKEIAAELVISPKTARNHIEHIYVKTGATSRVEASLFAIRHGLLEAASS